MSYIQINHVHKYFGLSQVLKEFSLHMEQGELVTLLGPSGCGKSTLLRCIAGLEAMESGEIVLQDVNITRLAPQHRSVGLVFQSYALFPNMTVHDNIGFGLKMQGLRTRELDARVEDMLRLIDLEAKKSAYPHELSGGQQQRVALARSLILQPKLMLMDEPLSALDAKIRKTLRMEFRQLQKKLGMTTLFVTHDQEEALMISDRICVMNEGRIVQIGTPEQIYTEPRNEFVARFIGNYNVMGGTVLCKLAGPNVQASIQYAIRPETILMERKEISADIQGDFYRMNGTIQEVTVLGSVLRYTVDVDGNSWTVDRLNASMQRLLAEGEEVRLHVPVQECKPLL